MARVLGKWRATQHRLHEAWTVVRDGVLCRGFSKVARRVGNINIDRIRSTSMSRSSVVEAVHPVNTIWRRSRISLLQSQSQHPRLTRDKSEVYSHAPITNASSSNPLSCSQSISHSLNSPQTIYPSRYSSDRNSLGRVYRCRTRTLRFRLPIADLSESPCGPIL